MGASIKRVTSYSVPHPRKNRDQDHSSSHHRVEATGTSETAPIKVAYAARCLVDRSERYSKPRFQLRIRGQRNHTPARRPPPATHLRLWRSCANEMTQQTRPPTGTPAPPTRNGNRSAKLRAPHLGSVTLVSQVRSRTRNTTHEASCGITGPHPQEPREETDFCVAAAGGDLRAITTLP